MKKLVVLISNKGTGTNLQAIIDGIKSGRIDGQIAAVVSDTPDAKGLERAKRYNLQIEICPRKEDLLPLLKKLDSDYICLTGWKQIILPEVIDEFPNRILNTHPGLIPDTLDGVVKNPDGTEGLWNRGKLTEKAIQNVLDQDATYAGCTNHFLSEEFDFGQVLGRCFEKVQPGDTAESLYTRLKVKENKLYVDVLVKLTEGNMKKQITILITDGGGRGAALVDKYGQSKNVGRILVVPGNDLMQINTKIEVKIFPNLKTTSVKEILEIVKSEKVDLVDVAQDNAVEAGVADALEKIGVVVVGPNRKAGQLEWDKAWSRKFMTGYKIPTPKYYTFHSEQDGIEFIKKIEAEGRNPERQSKGWFVKASGLAEGKGAIPANDIKEAISAIKQMKKFGNSGKTFLLEQWLEGEEFSAFALCDGKDFVYIGAAQDHKRVFDNDKGENTGGMGCVSNPLIVNKDVKKQVLDIFYQTIEGMRKEGRPYKGVLYLGGMVVSGKVYIIEFNARWGDPEAEILLSAIKNDLYEIDKAIIAGKIRSVKLKVDKKVRVVVAATAKGYPVDYSNVKGKKVFGIDKASQLKDIKIYGAGIKKVHKDYFVNGGRVLYIVGAGRDVIEARKKAYRAINLISIEGNNLHYRTDIGFRDVERLRKKL